jgi:hypothetical protein
MHATERCIALCVFYCAEATNRLSVKNWISARQHYFGLDVNASENLLFTHFRAWNRYQSRTSGLPPLARTAGS